MKKKLSPKGIESFSNGASLLILCANILGKKAFFVLVCLSFFAIFLDIMSVALLIPLLKIADGSRTDWITNSWLGKFINIQDFNSIELVVLMFFVFIAVKNIALYFINSKKYQYIFQIQSSLSESIFQKYLGKKFKEYSGIHLSEITRNTVSEVGHLVSLVTTLFDLIAEIIIFISIALIVINTNYFVALFILIYGITSYLIYRVHKNTLGRLGKLRIDGEKSRLKIIQDTYNSIKEIKIYNSEKFYLNKYSDPNISVASTHALENSIRPVNKYIFEVLTVLFMYFFIRNYSVDGSYYSQLFLIAAALFRIFPSLNRIIGALQQMSVHKHALKKINELYFAVGESWDKESHPQKLQDFSILQYQLERFSINDQRIFKDLEISIEKKNKITLLQAESGFGKSVLISCLTGLFDAEGRYLIDGQEVDCNQIRKMNLFSLNSQSAPLLNDSIFNNIIFDQNKSEVNISQLNLAIEVTGLKNILSNLDSGINTIVSDRGHNFSGGQGQRIALARTIYKNRKIMVLDESLSALDKNSQSEILRALRHSYAGNVLLITHDVLDSDLYDEVIKID